MSDLPGQPGLDGDSRPEDGFSTKPRTRRSRIRGIAYFICSAVIVASTAGILVLRSRAEVIGFDYANVATFVLMFLALLTLMPLILLRPNVSLRSRLLAAAAVLLMMSGPLLLLRLEGFDGRLMPIVNWRWVPESQPLERPPEISADAEHVDLATRTPSDFPQFLGPERHPDLPSIELDRDWESRPPKLLWRQPIGAGWAGFSVVNGYAVTMEQRGENEVVTCYAVESGDVIWAHAHRARHETVLGGVGPRSTPTIDEGWVYALGATGYLRCLDGATGTLVWSDDLLQRCGVTEEQDLAAISWGRAASPLVVGDLVVVPLGGPPHGPCHSLAAYDKRTGELRWLGGDQQAGYASPSLETLCGLEQIVILNESSVSGHRLEDGSVIWSYPWEGQSNADANCSQAVVLPNDRVLLTNRKEAELVQVSPTGQGTLQAESVWVGRGKLKTKFTNVIVRNGHIYGLSDGILECVELATGRRCWKERQGDYGHGQILGVGDVILVQAESGQVVMVELNPDRLVELGRLHALSGRTWNNPTLFGSLLLVRNASEAACYRLSPRK